MNQDSSHILIGEAGTSHLRCATRVSRTPCRRQAPRSPQIESQGKEGRHAMPHILTLEDLEEEKSKEEIRRRGVLEPGRRRILGGTAVDCKGNGDDGFKSCCVRSWFSVCLGPHTDHRQLLWMLDPGEFLHFLKWPRTVHLFTQLQLLDRLLIPGMSPISQLNRRRCSSKHKVRKL